jgi:hypothetical protein
MGAMLSALEPNPFPDRATGELRRGKGRLGMHFMPDKPQAKWLPSNEVSACKLRKR